MFSDEFFWLPCSDFSIPSKKMNNRHQVCTSAAQCAQHTADTVHWQPQRYGTTQHHIQLPKVQWRGYQGVDVPLKESQKGAAAPISSLFSCEVLQHHCRPLRHQLGMLAKEVE
eukprot:EG_transcript_55501